ncbi:MAG: hypothetical protein WDZ51_01865 [Pirellulaceae bacterium]
MRNSRRRRSASISAKRSGGSIRWLLLLPTLLSPLLLLPLVGLAQESAPTTTPAKVATEVSEATSADDATPAERLARVQQLIESLGHNNFTIRERAQTELSRMGVDAFDLVFEAMRDDDPEVARRAQYLIRSIDLEWILPEFGDEVKALLTKYGDQGLDNRRSRILQLANLGTLDAAKALARISRYESTEVLSKEAAIALALNFERLDRAELAETVDQFIGGSPRTGPTWLQTFALSLRDREKAMPTWREFVQEEASNLSGKPSTTNWQLILDLVRWEVRELRALNRQEDAIEAMRELTGISVNFSDKDLIDLTTWLLEHDGGPVVEQLARLHAKPGQDEAVGADQAGAVISGRFAKDPTLLYLLAEAILVQGRPEEAQKVADQALEIAPDSKDSHRMIGYQLQERGTFRWAEREYRQAFEGLDMTNMLAVSAGTQLAEMLHDMGDDAAAVEAFKPMAEALMKLDGTGQQLDPKSNEIFGGRVARYFYFQARVAQEKGDLAKAKEHYRKSMEYDETESDSLIHMYALDQDPDWQKEVKEKIDSYIQFYKPVVERFQEQIEFFKRNARGRDVMGGERTQMAIYMNQYAWLVGNTYGDIDHAIDVSLLSLELRPGEGAYLDTLAHCYARNKDYANAVKYQVQALRQMPHSRQIREAYTQFADLHEEENGPFDREELAVGPDTYFE